MNIPTSFPFSDPAARTYTQERLSYWDSMACMAESSRGLGKYYHRRQAEIYQNLVQPELKVVEFGCGQGDLLAALRPAGGTFESQDRGSAGTLPRAQVWCFQYFALEARLAIAAYVGDCRPPDQVHLIAERNSSLTTL